MSAVWLVAFVILIFGDSAEPNHCSPLFPPIRDHLMLRESNLLEFERNALTDLRLLIWAGKHHLSFLGSRLSPITPCSVLTSRPHWQLLCPSRRCVVESYLIFLAVFLKPVICISPWFLPIFYLVLFLKFFLFNISLFPKLYYLCNHRRDGSF